MEQRAPDGKRWEQCDWPVVVPKRSPIMFGAKLSGPLAAPRACLGEEVRGAASQTAKALLPAAQQGLASPRSRRLLRVVRRPLVAGVVGQGTHGSRQCFKSCANDALGRGNALRKDEPCRQWSATRAEPEPSFFPLQKHPVTLGIVGKSCRIATIHFLSHPERYRTPIELRPKVSRSYRKYSWSSGFSRFFYNNCGTVRNLWHGLPAHEETRPGWPCHAT